VKQIITSLTQRGQLTMPVEVQRLLGVKPRDQVIWEIDEGETTVRSAPTLESVFGSVPAIPGMTTDDFDRQIEEATEDEADRFMRKFNRQ